MRLPANATVNETTKLWALARAEMTGEGVVDCAALVQCDTTLVHILRVLRDYRALHGLRFEIINVKPNLRRHFSHANLAASIVG